ncbi:MAG: hypothetical protein JSU86_05260 [Phycisphaerales bacterium]|nr:MAG: hypothetical protein JSU86_05260 [Phycisphaerales bacterium]
MGPITALFAFTIRQTLLNRKICLPLIILAAPTAIIILIRNFAGELPEVEAAWRAYHSLVQFLLIQLLIPLVCLIYGTALVGADVDAGTIVYLTTRRMRRRTMLLVKFAANVLVLVVLCDLSIVLLHACTFVGLDLQSVTVRSSAFADWNPTTDFCYYLLIIPAGVLGFLAVFTLIGLLTARPLTLSIFYLVVVELIVSNIPVGARVYSVTHYLRVTMAGVIPELPRVYELPEELSQELYSPGATGLPELFGITLVALALTTTLVTVRELMPAKLARE